MTLDYTKPGEVQILMIPYIEKMLEDFPESIYDTAITPAADHLFTTRTDLDAKKLLEEQAIAFHHNVAKLLFVSNCACRDIQMPVAFLTACMKEHDDDDWGKLKRVMKYLCGTKKLCLTLHADEIGITNWHVDASYATPNNCRGQTKAMMTLG